MKDFKFILSDGTDILGNPERWTLNELRTKPSLYCDPPPTSIPCSHEQCPECHGKGTKQDGTVCIHWIYCSCPKCSPWC